MRAPIAPGDRFERLTFIERRPDKGQAKGRFSCSCGNEYVGRIAHVKNGSVRSCGCLFKEWASKLGESNIRHGMKGTGEWHTWSAMRSRCLNPRNRQYPQYGGRGIYICQEWIDSFEAFFADMGPQPNPTHTLDRRDNSGPYSKENCRWATPKQQGRNTRQNVLLTFRGQTKTMIEWAEEYGMRHSTLRERLMSGKTTEDALTTPVRHYRRRA